MNLTTFVGIKEVRARLREAFPKPKFSRKAEIIAEPQTKNYGMIGTAFDYLLRFFIEANNDTSRVISTPWAAAVLQCGASPASQDMQRRPLQAPLGGRTGIAKSSSWLVNGYIRWKGF